MLKQPAHRVRMGAALLSASALIPGSIALSQAQRNRTTTTPAPPSLFAAAPAAQRPVAPAPASRPNIVIIMADDMGYSDIGCYGGDIDTPNIDRLASEGLRFTQFYNAARCCPTRASLMTGLYPHQTGVGGMQFDLGVDGYRGELNNHCVTIAQVLRGAGYATYMTGKWHLCQDVHTDATTPQGQANWPIQRGFDHYYGIIKGAANYFHPDSLTVDNQRLAPPEDNYYTTDAFSDHAASFITGRDKSKPFFLYLAYNAPHWPLNAKPGDLAKYRGRFDRGWDVLRQERYQRMVRMGLVNAAWPLSPHEADWNATPDHPALLRKMETYAAQVDCMDQGIGRVVAALKQSGAYDNTLIFFLSDNGACHEAQGYGVPWANLSNTPYRLYKHWTHEGGISTPLIVHWPTRIHAHGDLRAQTGEVMDLMATCVDVAHANYPTSYRGQSIDPMEGRSLVPAFDNHPIQRDAIYWEHEGNRAMRMGDWKLVAASTNRNNVGPWELYNVAQDRTEGHNLITAEPARAHQMEGMWQTWADRVHVTPYPPGQRPGAEHEEEGDPVNTVPTPQIAGKPLTIRCDVTAQSANGVILAQGGAQNGYALYLVDGKITFGVREQGALTSIAAPDARTGRVSLEARLQADGSMSLAINGTIVARGTAPGPIRNQPVDRLSIGRDIRGAVGNYAAPNPLDGTVENVQISTE